MPAMVKFLLGALATAILTWFLYGPMGLGSKCEAERSGGAVAAADGTGGGTGADGANAAGVAGGGAMNEAPASREAVANCQANVNSVAETKKINFGSGNAVITDFSMPSVEALADAAKNCAGTQIEVGGHTDQMGSDVTNMALSQARADAVMAALIKRGIPAERLTAKGYGETKLLDTATSRAALAKNRRIEFIVTTTATSGAAE